MPIPSGATPNRGSDGVMTVMDLSTNTVSEYWQVRQTPDGDWTTTWGAENSMSGSGWGGSSTGAGASRIGGVVRVDEIAAGVIDHALVILLITLWAAGLAGYLTMPALAALLIVTAWLMSEPHRWGERMKLRRGDRTLLFLTMILTVSTDLTIAIAVGTAAGLAMRLARRDVEPEEWTPSDRSKL